MCDYTTSGLKAVITLTESSQMESNSINAATDNPPVMRIICQYVYHAI